MTLKTDRNLIALVAGAVVVAVICAALAAAVHTLRTDNRSLKARQKEFLALRDEASLLKKTVEASESRQAGTKAGGIVQAVDETVKAIGIGQKVKSIKPTGTRDLQYATEEAAEAQLEKLTMNELVNLLYRIENGPVALSVRKTSIKISFENPSLLNVSCIISLAKPK